MWHVARWVFLLLVVVFAGTLLGLSASLCWAGHKANAKAAKAIGPAAERDAKFDKIEAKEIVLKSGDGKHEIVLTSFEHGVGVWITNRKEGTHASMVSLANQSPWIGLQQSKQTRGAPLAFQLDDKGNLFVQLVIDGKFIGVDAARLKKLAD